MLADQGLLSHGPWHSSVVGSSDACNGIAGCCCKLFDVANALAVQESKKNMLKDFVNVAGPLGVTHFVILTATQGSCYMRVAKSPRVSSKAPIA